jgi:endonuclease YncB( thermonuclease family)
MIRLFATRLMLLFICSMSGNVWAHGFAWPPQTKTTISVPVAFSAKVVGVKDGDTVDLLYAGATVRARLAHIDAPEGGQPFGKAAKQRLSDLCFGKWVQVERTGRPDRYGRLIVVLQCERVNVNRALVASGLAWHFAKYSKDVSYASVERQARAARLGLWADPGAVAPWDWRASRRKKK